MDNVISKIGSLLKPIFEHPILQQDADNNLALGIDVFMCAALDVDRAIIKDDDLLTMAKGFKKDYASYISQAQADLVPLLKHSINRGVPNERIIEYGLEGFIERLLVAYPSYMPLMLKGLFN